MGAVNDVESYAGKADQEEEYEDDEDEPEAESAAPSAAAPAVVRLGAIGRSCGAVELCFGGWE